jgi:predicted RND superfamily exporter protein
LILWANSFREITLPNGEIIRGTGEAVVFSDMLLKIGEDAPKVALASFLGTVLVILIAFKRRLAGWVALGTLALGVTWLVAFFHLTGVKLNFLNFLALPIAIGVGSDYAINVMKRREIEGDAGIEKAFIETGGAVVACSMTTLCGYAALLLSVNGAVRSMGLAAGFGEAATQLAAMLVLPALLYSMGRKWAPIVDDRRPAASHDSASPV